MRIAILAYLLAWPVVACAAIYGVPEPYPTIQAAIDACTEGDTVLLAAGTYSGEGNRNLLAPLSISLIGAGREATTVDCEGQGNAIEFTDASGVVEGMTFANGNPGSWATVHIRHSLGLQMRDVVFIDCARGGLSIFQSWGFSITDALFADVLGKGLEINTQEGGALEAVRVTFARITGNAAYIGWGTLGLTECVIAHNEGLALHGYVDPLYGPSGTINCTRCLLFGNWSGNYNQGEPVGHNGNSAVDPLFCDISGRDYRLHAQSPCLPENNAFGVLLGGTSLGCDMPRYAISGAARNQEGLPVPDVRIDGDYYRAFTDDAGVYAVLINAGTDITLVPSRHHADGFAPSQIAISDLQGDLPGQDFLCMMRDSVIEVPSEAATLQDALALSLAGDTILVAPGVYAGAGNRDLTPLAENLTIIGVAGSDSTIIDCEGQGVGFRIEELGRNAVLRGFGIKNAGDSGVSSFNTEMDLSDIVIENSAYAGLRIRGTIMEAERLLISGCGTLSAAGGAIQALVATVYDPAHNDYWEVPSIAQFRNCTLVNCTATENGSALYSMLCEVHLDSCIIAGNGPVPAIFSEDDYWGDHHVLVSCSDFHANAGGDCSGDFADPIGQDGNFAADPLFCGMEGSGDYSLQAHSPCLPRNNACGALIGARRQGCEFMPLDLEEFSVSVSLGAVDLTWSVQGEADFRLSATFADSTWEVAWQAAGEGRYSARDDALILAIGGEAHYRLEGRRAESPWLLLRTTTVQLAPVYATRLLSPHPNPFNPFVTIPFTLAAPGRARLDVFDLSGRHLERLTDEAYEVGRHEESWSGRGQPSGVYFVRLRANGHVESRRLVLLR